MKVQDIFDQAMAISDNVSTDGVKVSESDIIDYKLKTPQLINLGLAELVNDLELFGTKIITPIRNKNLLGDEVGFKTYLHKKDDIIFEIANAKMYSFEIDTEATVYLEEQIGRVWSSLEQIDIPAETQPFEVFRGYINASDPNNKIRLRFSGQYYYKIKNIAFFDCNIPLDRLEDYDEFVKYELPDEYKSMYTAWSDNGQHLSRTKDYYLEGRKTIVLPRDFENTYTFKYKKRHDKIISLDQELEVDEVNARPLAYFLLGNLMIDENPVISGFAFGKYDEERYRVNNKVIDAGEDTVENVYGGWD